MLATIHITHYSSVCAIDLLSFLTLCNFSPGRLKTVRRLFSNLSLGTTLEATEEEIGPYNTSAIESFLSQKYRGATLLEEHQV